MNTLFTIIAVVVIIGLTIVNTVVNYKATKSVTNNEELNRAAKISESILTVASTVVKSINQKFVDSWKSDSIDGKLTEEERHEAYRLAYEMISGLLSDEQKEYIETQYNNFSFGLDIIIEAAVRDNHSSYLLSSILDTEDEETSDDGSDDTRETINIATVSSNTIEELSASEGN